MPQTQTVNLKDFSKELGRFTQASIAEVKEGVASGVAQSIPEVVKDSPVDTGMYAQSWDMTVMQDRVQLGNFAPYAAVIEHGSRPGHMPPLGPLLAWAKRVLQDPSQPPGYSDQVQKLARGTQMKIFREGQMPKKVMGKNIPLVIENINAELKKRA